MTRSRTRKLRRKARRRAIRLADRPHLPAAFVDHFREWAEARVMDNTSL